VLGVRRWRELVINREKWRYCSTGQSPQRAVAPMGGGGGGDKTHAFLTFILAAGEKTCFASVGFMQLFPIYLIEGADLSVYSLLNCDHTIFMYVTYNSPIPILQNTQPVIFHCFALSQILSDMPEQQPQCTSDQHNWHCSFFIPLYLH
jgi:hypothetical protein